MEMGLLSMSVQSEWVRSYDEGINCRNENTFKRHFRDKTDNDSLDENA